MRSYNVACLVVSLDISSFLISQLSDRMVRTQIRELLTSFARRVHHEVREVLYKAHGKGIKSLASMSTALGALRHHLPSTIHHIHRIYTWATKHNDVVKELCASVIDIEIKCIGGDMSMPFEVAQKNYTAITAIRFATS